MVQVKPFGCFVHFSVELAGGEQKPLVGLVHCSEVAWDPAADVLQAVRVREGGGGRTNCMPGPLCRLTGAV